MAENTLPTDPVPASCSGPVALPLDVCLTIVDAVAHMESGRKLRPTLCACARVCRAMLRTAQVHLYVYVNLFSIGTFNQFARTIHESPRLGMLVVYLMADVGAAWRSTAPGDLPLPPHVVGQLRNLEDLVVIGVIGIFGQKRCSPQLETFVLMFAGCCPKLRQVYLSRFVFRAYEDLVRLVWSFPEMQTLQLGAVEFLDNPLPGEGPNPAMHHGQCEKLEVLKIELPPSCPPIHLGLLGSGPSLRDLNLHVAPLSASEAILKGLSELSCLQHLTLTFFAEEIRFIDTALRSMKAEGIRKISVIHFTIDWTREASLEWYENLKADRILAQPQFLSLERVHWTVLTRDRQDTHEGWRAGVGRCFPELCRRKLLCLYVSDRLQVGV